ncbi:MAG: DUF1553 domain-containing protein [Planctomycetota bacterium]|nr:MAG: DUF1553 domain-containing protein [Planctomycetota bacterium]
MTPPTGCASTPARRFGSRAGGAIRIARGMVTVALMLTPSAAVRADEGGGMTGGKPDASDVVRFFETDVRPLLARRCFGCHGPKRQKGGLRLDSRAAALRGGESGPAIVPGKPDESLLIEAVQYALLQMPPNGRLTDREVATLRRWIALGAPWPKSSTRVAAQMRQRTDWWSFRPVADPPVPDVADTAAATADPAGRVWSAHPIDRFVLRRLRQRGLVPAPPADRRTLIRRVYFDMLGLPPTQAEIAAFLGDRRPDAWPRLVDRLLADPRYGERWGRHWLDVVRYAESDGFRQDAYRPHAWRYRDYVIRSFNADKPYDRFVQEQLAGDELAPGDPEALVATGFLRHYLYEFNQRDVRTQWKDILTNVTDVTADVFLALGLSCARCHDHKFDPISQVEYFRFRAFFAPLLPRDDVPPVTPAVRARHAQALARWEQATASVRRRIDALRQPYLEKAAREAIAKFPEDIQQIMAKPADRRTPLERQFAYLVMQQVVLEQAKVKLSPDDEKKLQALQAALQKHERLKPPPLPVAYSVSDIGPTAPRVVIPGSEQAVEPGFPSAVHVPAVPIRPPFPGTTGRRLALARWLTQPEHPLTARVIVNRLWQYHFGRGLVETSGDFGHLGTPPSHPELLDWLTRRFVEHGWSLKWLHRQILCSMTYRQSSRHPHAELAVRVDPDNRLLWHFAVRRLEAEPVRDTLLWVAGRLDDTMFGPSVDARQPRRSVYTKVIRNTRDPLLDAFDQADGLNSVARRNVTTTPAQALLMLNGRWLLERAGEFAARVEADGGRIADGAGDQASAWRAAVRASFRLALQREPTAEEVEFAVGYLRRTLQLLRDKRPPAGPSASDPEWSGPWRAALTDWCHVLLNSNEFLYVE